jgi:hypothetical protein
MLQQTSTATTGQVQCLSNDHKVGRERALAAYARVRNA